MERFLLFEVLSDDVVDGGVWNREERGAQAGSGLTDLRREGVREARRQGRGVRDVEVKGVLESQAVKQRVERGDDVEVVGGLGGGEEVVEEGRGIGGEGVAHEADMDGERHGEGEEGGDQGIGGV